MSDATPSSPRSDPARSRAQSQMAALVGLARRLSAGVDASGSGDSISERDAVLRAVLTTAVRELGAESGAVLEPSVAVGGLTASAAVGTAAEDRALWDRIADRVSPSPGEAMVEAGLVSVPLRFDKGDPGSLVILAPGREFLPGDIDFLAAVVEMAAVAEASPLLAGEASPGEDGMKVTEGRRRKVRTKLVGRSPGMVRVNEVLARVQASNTPVLIQGETGTGKELIARAIHTGSARRQRPLVTIDCGALPVSLAESEIFGYRRGAFTDAQRDKSGLIERADGGTLFIDEVGDIGLDLQAKLLRFLQEGEVRRIGDLRPTRVDVRVVAATNRDLKERVEQGAFRLDLYYRLNVVTVHLPSLVERREDIPLLTEHFLTRLRTEMGRPGLSVDEDAMAFLNQHSWPGNVRELENTMRSAVVHCSGGVIGIADLPDRIRGEPLVGELSLRDRERQASERTTRQLLVQALERSGGDVQQAAALLRTPLKTIYYKLQRLGIRPANYRQPTGDPGLEEA